MVHEMRMNICITIHQPGTSVSVSVVRNVILRLVRQFQFKTEMKSLKLPRRTMYTTSHKKDSHKGYCTFNALHRQFRVPLHVIKSKRRLLRHIALGVIMRGEVTTSYVNRHNSQDIRSGQHYIATRITTALQHCATLLELEETTTAALVLMI